MQVEGAMQGCKKKYAGKPNTPRGPQFMRLTAHRDNMAIGVIARLFEIIATTIPGASLSSSGYVASGVTSLGENPVPPVVRTSGSLFTSAHSLRAA